MFVGAWLRHTIFHTSEDLGRVVWCARGAEAGAAVRVHQPQLARAARHGLGRSA